MDTPRGPILAKMFDEMDANGDGQIDEKEGVTIGRLLAGGDATMGKQFWAELKAGADDDGDGRISKEEYVRYGRSVTDAKAAHVLQLHLARLEEANARQARQSHRKLDPRAQATRVFRFLDTDGDGRVSLAELARLAETEAEALEDLPALFVLMDSEGFRRGDGSLTLEEWLAYAEDMPELREEHFGKALGAQLESAFAKPAAKRIGPLDRKARCEALFDEIDVDGNGYIDLKEYIAGMTTRAGGEPLSAEDEEEAQLEAAHEFMWMNIDEWRKAGAAIVNGEIAIEHRLQPGPFVDAFTAMHKEVTDDEFEIACRKFALHRKKPNDQAMRQRRAREVFDALDADGDGVLTRSEVMALQRGAAPSSHKSSTTNLLAPTHGRELRSALPLFFEHLDVGGAGSDEPDERLTVEEWSKGLLKAMELKDDLVFESMIDGMLTAVGKAAKPKAKGKAAKKK